MNSTHLMGPDLSLLLKANLINDDIECNYPVLG